VPDLALVRLPVIAQIGVLWTLGSLRSHRTTSARVRR
jgi:hypothetical protein